MKKENGNLFWTLVKLLLAAYIITGIILAVLAFLLWKSSPPSELISGGILFAYVISCFAGGLLLGKRAGKRKYLWGILFGVIYFAVILVMSLCFNGIVGEPIKNAVTVFALCCAGGMFGGMLG